MKTLGCSSFLSSAKDCFFVDTIAEKRKAHTRRDVVTSEYQRLSLIPVTSRYFHGYLPAQATFMTHLYDARSTHLLARRMAAQRCSARPSSLTTNYRRQEQRSIVIIIIICQPTGLGSPSCSHETSCHHP